MDTWSVIISSFQAKRGFFFESDTDICVNKKHFSAAESDKMEFLTALCCDAVNVAEV